MASYIMSIVPFKLTGAELKTYYDIQVPPVQEVPPEGQLGVLKDTCEPITDFYTLHYLDHDGKVIILDDHIEDLWDKFQDKEDHIIFFVNYTEGHLGNFILEIGSEEFEDIFGYGGYNDFNFLRDLPTNDYETFKVWQHAYLSEIQIVIGFSCYTDYFGEGDCDIEVIGYLDKDKKLIELK